VKKIPFKGKNLLVFEGVYEPAEDSFLLVEAVKVGKEANALDLGTGSGIQAINAALQGAQVLAVDVKEEALKNTLANAKEFGLREKISTRESNLFESVWEKFDAIVFNPPYVPSEEKELKDVDGGKNGRETLDLFLEQFPAHLNPNGKCFFLQSSLNGIEETEKKLAEKGLRFEIIARKKLFFEELVVFVSFL